MGLLDRVTDAIGLTDYRGAREARDQANMALSSQLGTSKELLDWWKTNSAPYQLGLMEKGLSLYDDAALTDDDYSRELGLVSGDVARSFGRARDATGREMLSYGLNPSSGRFASMLTTTGNQQAAAEAAARNAARRGLSDTEFARKSSALGLASGLNTPNYGLVGTGMGGLSSAAGQYGNMASSMDAANQAALGGLLQGAGAAYGGYLSKAADGGAKTKRGFKKRYANGRKVGEKFMGNAERVDAPRLGLPQIRGEMRGPGTPVSDDIPVMAEDGGEARLADGEVVMPTDTVAKLGLSLYRANPEAAMHKLGVAALEEIIDETHVPADVQREQGLSVDPRGVEGYADGKKVKRPPLGTGMAEGAAKTIEERKRRMAQALSGYADGGQSGWGLGLSMLGHGLANAYSRGGWLEGVRSGERSARQAEEAEFQRSQRERMLEEQARQDEYRTASEQAIADATQFTGGDVMDPEFGVTAQTGDPTIARGLRLAQPDMERARPALLGLQAKYKPDQYLSSIATADKEKAGREWEREKLGLQHQNKLAQIEQEAKRRAAYGGGAADPVDVRTSEWMVAKGIAKTPEEAWNKVRMARIDPAGAVADIAKGMADEQKASYLTKDDPEYRSYGQMVEEAKGIVRGILDSYSGGKIEPTPANSAAATTLKKSYTHPSGKSVTLESIRETAKKRGLTEEEVIKRLGLK